MQTIAEPTTAKESSSLTAIFSIVCGVMIKYGFGPAFSVISISYLLAMSLLVLLRMPHKGEARLP